MEREKFINVDRVVFETEQYSEDFIVVKGRNTTINAPYLAFYTKGTEQEQRLWVATASDPIGPFTERKGPLYPSMMRLGSIILPCEQTDWKWRLYFSRTFSYYARVVCFIESNNLVDWHNETILNMNFNHAMSLFGKERSLFVQPCCRLVEDIFLLLINRVTIDQSRSVDFSCVDSFVSYGGLNFMPYKLSIITPNPGAEFSKKVGNPYFIYHNRKVDIFVEGNAGPGWHIFNFELVDDVIKGDNRRWFDDSILANPSIEIFDGVYYLYYGRYDGTKYRVYVAVGKE